jgi:hypothetical protein
LAYVAAKPEIAPETVVSYHFAFALLGAGGALPAEAISSKYMYVPTRRPANPCTDVSFGR